MKIAEIEYTPNPNAVKFILDQPITMGGMTRSFESPEQAEGVPLAEAILANDHVESAFFADRWITVTRDGEEDWHGLLRAIAEPIRDSEYDDAQPEVGASGGRDEDDDDFEDDALDDPRVERIREVIGEQILPYLQGDGGGLELKALVDDQLMIRYQGACGTCPASLSGTLMAIENLIQSEVDSDITVVSV